MGEQVITIGTDGSIHGLQMKKGEGLDLREFSAPGRSSVVFSRGERRREGDARAKIHRATLIEWVEDAQRWQVAFLDREGAVAGWLTYAEWTKAHNPGRADGSGGFEPVYPVIPEGAENGPCDVFYFDDYGEAVGAEQAIINAAKLSGYGLPGQDF